MNSLQLEEFSDRELLSVLEMQADDYGFADAETISDQLGLDHPHPKACVTSRLVWLTRYGAVEVDPLRKRGHPQRWRLTEKGNALVSGSLKAGQEKALGTLADEQMIEVMRFVTNRWRNSDDTTAHLTRREWIYGTSARRNGRH